MECYWKEIAKHLLFIGKIPKLRAVLQLDFGSIKSSPIWLSLMTFAFQIDPKPAVPRGPGEAGPMNPGGNVRQYSDSKIC